MSRCTEIEREEFVCEMDSSLLIIIIASGVLAVRTLFKGSDTNISMNFAINDDNTERKILPQSTTSVMEKTKKQIIRGVGYFEHFHVIICVFIATSLLLICVFWTVHLHKSSK
uniref:Uncharacterized protein n=1 Tax=Parascaris equorum TaxID=6256 RepID=A0A914SI32_PAREQ